MKRFLCLGFVLSLYVICTGCGDTFRPIIIPNPPVFPNPRAAHTVVSINDNAPPPGQTEVVRGTAMVIDVSGDTEVSIANVGLAPVHAVQQSAFQVLVVNHSVSVTGNNGDSLTQLNFSGVTIGSAITISLPANSAPNFVAAAPSSTTAYVTLPNYLDPITSTVVPSIGVVSTLTDTLVTTKAVGTNPDALAVTPNNSKLYVANQGSDSVSGFNILPQQLSPRTVNGSFSGPLWLIVRSDSQRAYVLGGDGVVSTIDTTSTAGPDNVIDASVIVAGATYMLYDANLNRLYIPGTSELTILDVSPSAPVLLAGGPIPICGAGTQSSSCISMVPSSSRGTTDPCFGNPVQTPLTLVGVAALPDGSRAYVGAFYVDSKDNVCPQITVIDAASNTVKSSTAVPGFPDATVPGSPYYVPVCASPTTRFRFMMAAAGDSTRAYLSSCDGGNVNVVDTTNDTYILNLQAPIGTRPPISGSLNPPQNPVFLIAGP